MSASSEGGSKSEGPGATEILSRIFPRLVLPRLRQWELHRAIYDLKQEKLLDPDDYHGAMRALNMLVKPPTPPPPPIQMLYSKVSPPTISPEEVMQLCMKPLERPLTGFSIRLHRITESLVAKRSPSPAMVTEAQSILFVREHTSIPVPDVYLIFSVGRMFYYVADYIPGGDLQYQWSTLDVDSRQSVLRQTQHYLQELRSLPPPGDMPGPVDGGECRCRWFSEDGAGPFADHQDLVDWWNSLLPVENGRHTNDGEGQFTTHYSLVFTHGDFVPRNFIFHNGNLWVVDWEQSGWYPEYVEYALIAKDSGMAGYSTPADWKDAVLALLPDYSREYRLLCQTSNLARRWYARPESSAIVARSIEKLKARSATRDEDIGFFTSGGTMLRAATPAMGDC
ncbi:kinase-like protein [Cubamyces sp. BRFM 1775]|nr:kinase-like protein [Cubamyces sp. BRFM 1775]